MSNYQLFKGPEVKNATFVAHPGFYRIECWGAQGYDDDYGGPGAYVSGSIKIQTTTNLFIYVAQKGQFLCNDIAFNGGGKSQNGGGGASDVRLVDGPWNDFESLKSRIIVAAGGGGYDGSTTSAGRDNGGAGGDQIGQPSRLNSGQGGNQTAGGDGDGDGKGQFGCGGSNNRIANSGENDGAGAGGGGYYGGGASQYTTCYGGGGGSSFISGHDGCDAISENSTSFDNIIHTHQTVHFSGLKFFNSIMIPGTEEMISPSGEKEKGHSGDGAVKITIFNLIYAYCSCKHSLINFRIHSLLLIPFISCK